MCLLFAKSIVEPSHNNATADTHADDYNLTTSKKAIRVFLASSPLRKERSRHLTYLIKLLTDEPTHENNTTPTNMTIWKPKR